MATEHSVPPNDVKALDDDCCFRCGGTGQDSTGWNRAWPVGGPLVCPWCEARFDDWEEFAYTHYRECGAPKRTCIHCAGVGREPGSVAALISDGIRVRRGGATSQKCANCGRIIDVEHNLDPDYQRALGLHLEACALAVQCRIDESLDTIAAVLTGIAEDGRLTTTDADGGE